MLQKQIRNIAIIAHVDHGKTTLVDKLLKATDAFRANQQVQDRILDSNDQERERGITILSKNISIEYKGVKINVIDTPGHADFGGEVERVLKMADGALLLVDAAEGPMPQTRFVLRHAIDAKLQIMLVINKIDREGADPQKAMNDSLDLMMDLGATDEQLEFTMEHVIYASAVNGFARLDPDDGNMDMYPMLDMIIDAMPAPDVDPDGPLAMQVVTIDHSDYVGRIGVGRVYSGTIHQNDRILVVKNDGSRAMSTGEAALHVRLPGPQGVRRGRRRRYRAPWSVSTPPISATSTPIRRTRSSSSRSRSIRRPSPSSSSLRPLRSSDVTATSWAAASSRSAWMQERENNVTMRIEELPDKTGVEVAGRGILHLSVLMEQMRREGFEFQVGRPKVLFKKDENGNKLGADRAGRGRVSGRVLRQGHRGLRQRRRKHDAAWSRPTSQLTISSSRFRRAASWASRTAS
jgi:GTP-binding protein